MLETIVLILVVLWILGLVTSTTMGGLIHILSSFFKYLYSRWPLIIRIKITIIATTNKN